MRKRWLRREHLFFIVTGLIEGVLTALTLATGKIFVPGDGLTSDLALRIGVASGFPTAVVFFAAEYARERHELLRMAHELNLAQHRRLSDGKLGRQAWHESWISAMVSGLCAFAGASIPLLIASAVPGSGWPAIVAALGFVAILGAGIGYATLSCKSCWAAALMVVSGLLAWLGYLLHVV